MATSAAKAQQKVHTFVWEGSDRKGQKTKGEIQGPNLAIVKAELRKQGFNAQKVRKKSASLFGERKKPIKPADIAIFSRQLATMLKAGVPLVQSFDIVADGLTNATMRELILSIKADVEGGNNLATALEKHPQYFDDLFCSLVDSGEQSGALETLLDRVATYKEKTEALKAKIKKATRYPIAVLVVAGIVTGILLIKVVPSFQELFSGFGADLPAPTKFVIAISEWMQSWWWAVLGVIIATVVTIKQLKQKSEAFGIYMDKLALKAPVVGNIVYESIIARYCRTLATTFAAGVPLVEALESVSGATGNVVYKDAVNKIKEDVSSGTQLAFSMKSTGLFPSMANQMVSIGEESGALDEMLEKVASHYEAEVDSSVDSLTSLMEPIIMSFLGVVVGGLIIAMYLPIFQMGKAIGGG